MSVHILESISEDRTRVAQYILLSTNTIQTILSPFAYFFERRLFPEITFIREMKSERKGRDEKMVDGFSTFGASSLELEKNESRDGNRGPRK